MNTLTILTVLSGIAFFGVACFLLGRWFGKHESADQLYAARLAISRSAWLAEKAHTEAAKQYRPTVRPLKFEDSTWSCPACRSSVSQVRRRCHTCGLTRPVA